MVQNDVSGLTLTVETREAAEAWNAMQRAFLAHGADTPDHLSRALTAAPDFALAHAVKGLFCLLLCRSEMRASAAEALTRAEAAARETGVTWREAAYLRALAAWLDGRPSGAIAALEEIATRHPEDMMAVKLDQAIRFLLGDRRGMERMARQVQPAYARHPHRAFAQGCLAFALEENGHYAEAERAGRAALEEAPEDAWARHAVAHVYDMTGQAETGIAWLSAPETWAHCNNFGCHVWWHLALFHLDRGETDRVLALYDRHIRAERTDDYRDISNGAAMLMRLELEGVDVGERWEEMADLAAGRIDDGSLVFADLHYLLALQGAGRWAEAEALTDRLIADASRGLHDMHEVAEVAGAPAAIGLAAFRSGDYALAFSQLRAARPHLQQAGGSHAQRDVFSRIMVEAAIRARDWEGAEAELTARTGRRGASDGYTARRREAIALARRGDLAAE